MSLPNETSVLIVGAGPAGLTLANLLGSEGVPTLLVERNEGCVPEPRAVALDGESLRTLQAVGLANTVTAKIKQGFVADYINGEGVQLFTTAATARPYRYWARRSGRGPASGSCRTPRGSRSSCLPKAPRTSSCVAGPVSVAVNRTG